MKFLINLITQSPWGLQALLYATGALLIICIGLGVTVAIQSAKLDAAKARQAALADKIATQNQAVAIWKTEADKQSERANEAAKKAEKVRTKTIERVRTITVASIPSSCPDAVRWGAEQALRFNRHWEKEDE